MTGYLRASLATVSIFAALGLSRYVDGFIRVFLRQQTGETFLAAMARNLRLGEAVWELLTVVGFGVFLWLAVSLFLFWLSEHPLDELLTRVGRSMVPLLLPVGLTLLACLSLTISPRFPYGSNLVLTLAYEGSFATVLTWSAFALSLVTAVWYVIDPRLLFEFLIPDRPRRFGGGVAVVVLATTIFALATPSWLWKDGEGQGNMFKYLRMAAVVSASGSLDIAKAEGAAERASFPGFVSQLPRMGWRWMMETFELVGAFVNSAGRGKLYVGDVVATRANRSMFRSPDGGIYYIHAPGPGLLLVPSYLADRALNRWLGWNRQVATILFWNFLGALLVLEIFRAAREVDVGWGAAAVTAFALAVSPPLLPYTYQIYPELPAALCLLFAFRKLFIEPAPSGNGLLAGAAAIAVLPWLHQKYALTAAVMGVLTAWRIMGSAPNRADRVVRLGLLSVPLAFSALSLTVFNHALTGSILPDATFRAAGRAAFEPGNGLSGFLGLFLDAENGLFVYAPIYLMALVGLGRLVFRHREIRFYLAAVVLSYVVVIASFPYWPGAVSSVARYILSVAPLAAISLVFVARRSFSDGVLAGVSLGLFAASVSFTLAFQKDLVASHLTKLLLDRTLYSDPYQYLPSFLSEGIIGSGPAHYYKLAAMAVLLVLLVYMLTPRVERETLVRERDTALFPWRVALGAATGVGFLLVMGGLLEHVPSNTTEKTGPVYNDTHALRGAPKSARFWSEGRYAFENRGVWVPGGGATRFFVQSSQPLSQLRVAMRNPPRENRVQIVQRGSASLNKELAPSSREALVLPLRRPYEFRGPSGSEWIYELTVRSRGSFVPRREGTGEDPRRLGCFVVLSAM
jgi:hypothetical protein